MTKMTSQFPRGSEWRRWDLHIHTPGTALEDKFGGDWSGYLDAIEAQQSVRVVGITDYLSIEHYSRIMQERKSGRLANLDFILPNIEFRIGPETNKGSAVNIHLLVSPEADDHEARISRSLEELVFRFTDHENYRCNRIDLTRLGEAYEPTLKGTTGAYKEGVNQFKIDFSVFASWWEKQSWLKSNSLLFVSGGNDGLGGLSFQGGWGATRMKVAQLSDAIFVANPNDRLFWLGKTGNPQHDDTLNQCGGRKPCLHGSDAHELKKLFEPDGQRYCWIKADPTFEGLRQVLHEPEDRVHIGTTPPRPDDESKIITKITLTGAPAWFAQSEIELNSGLVAIIGEKGSGKTALAELIALSAGAWDGLKRSSSFISKAHGLLNGLSATATWGDARTTRGVPGESLSGGAEPIARYLSQDFVEELCSNDLSGKRLVEEIDEVVFSHIEPSDQLETSSFADLRRIKVAHLADERDSARAKQSRLNAEIVRLEDELATRDTKVAFVKKCDEDIAAIDKQLPELQSAADTKVIADLDIEHKDLKEKNATLSDANLRLNRIRTARSRLLELRSSIEEQFASLAELLSAVGLPKPAIEAFKPVIQEGCEAPLDVIEHELKLVTQTIRGNGEAPDPAGTTIADIQSRIAKLELHLAADQKQRERLLALQKQKAKLIADKERASLEIKKLDDVVAKTLLDKCEQRWTAYLSFFGTLQREKQILEELYSPLDRVVAQDHTGTKAGFQLQVNQIVNVAAWIESGAELFDKRKKRDLPTLSQTDFEKIYQKDLIDPWSRGDVTALRQGLEKFTAEIGASPTIISTKLASHATRLKLYDWLYSPEHVTLSYGLTYQGTPLEALSPGARGIVLLVLYLAMDQHDTRPLIIDQPEGNLDNASIFGALVPFLRHAKQKRQIILVTHNPNLVVTTDAEQVIVASAFKASSAPHPTISYFTGALENIETEASIRRQTVRLLEGGPKPFKVRERRYNLSKSEGR